MKRYVIWALGLSLTGLLSCTEVKTEDSCGDGFLDANEECEGFELRFGSCQDLGYYRQTGNLSCQADCTIDRAPCEEFCGDGVIQALHETCDGADLAGLTCDGLGLGGGTLGCTAGCALDTSACDVQPSCGDGNVTSPVEQCEGDDLQDQSCQSLGYASGQLACGADCRYDVTACVPVGPTCGNGAIDAGETCDGANLGGATCQNQGFDRGELSCTGDCHLNTSGCEHTCGNGVWDNGEACDGSDLHGASCIGLGFLSGQLACSGNCQFDTSPCIAAGECGDGVWDNGEACDGNDLHGASCIGLGHTGGQLTCTGDCQFDESTCEDGPTCGNGISEGGEVCDGNDLNGETCSSRGYYAGTLSCAWDCQSFDESYCVNP